MLTVAHVDEGVLETNYMWLPTFIGLNSRLINDINKAVADVVVPGIPIPEALEKAHELIIQLLVKEFPSIEGLAEYLDKLRLVSFK